MGSETYLYTNTGSHNLIARSQIQTRSEIGHEIELVIRMNAVHFFEMVDKNPYRKTSGEIDIETWGVYCPRIV